MKMIPGTGTISDYGSYISNCTLKQLPYKVPVPSLDAIQLYIDIGTTKPTTVLYELIHTCGPNAGDVETLATTVYQIGQDQNNRWFGVFKNLIIDSGVDLKCFVIAITLDAKIYYSEEFCIDDCDDPKYVQGCYGNLDANISTDCNGIYFGHHVGDDTPLGNTSVTYKHKVYLRGIEVTLQNYKNVFKQGITRTFRTEQERIYQFWAELIPEWYMEQVNGVFFRGEVNIDGTRYLLNETLFEKVEECLKQWKPTATFRDSCFQSFSCEDDPCAEPPEECCAPVFLSATVGSIADESSDSGFPPAGNDDDTIVVVQSTIGGTTLVTGTGETFTGLTDGSSVVSSPALVGKRVFVMRGLLPVPGIDPGGGGQYYTKNEADNFITFSQPLVDDEFVYMETIN